MIYEIDPEFKAYLPPQTEEETAALTAKILEEGVRPGSLIVAVLPDGLRYLIDGHHTQAICEAIDIEPPEPLEVVFADREAVFAWMRKNQLARRNLTIEQRAYFIGKEFEAQKRTQGVSPLQNEGLSPNNTAQKVANANKTSRATVERNAKFAAAVDKIGTADPKAKEDILKGESTATKAQVIAAERIRCANCIRKGNFRDGCEGCAQAAAAAIKKPKPAPKVRVAPAGRKPDQYDETPIHQAFADLTLAFNARFEELGGDSNWERLEELMPAVWGAYEAWRLSA